MPVILRIDVDNPYGWHSFPRKVLNYFSINYRRLPIRYGILGYLDKAKLLFQELIDVQVPATWFFLPQTRPPKQFINSLLKNKHEIAYHAERTSSLRDFNSDLELLSKRLPSQILGFSKHGSGELKLSKYHTAEYELETMLEIGQEAGMRYFSGNNENPTSQAIQKNQILVFPGAFWINENYREVKKYSINWLIENASTGKSYVVLTHPNAWAFSNKEREDLRKIVELVDEFQTFSSIIS